MPSCSVVMVSYHTKPILFASVKCVLKQKDLAELIVVDNGNPPDTVARLRQIAISDPRLIILTGHGNVGFSLAANLGTGRATGDFLLLLNPGCLLPPDALAGMMDAFERMPQATLAGCCLENPDGSELHSARPLLTLRSALIEVLGIRRLLPSGKPLPADHTHEVSAIPSAFMGIRRPDYERLQGLDGQFFLQIAGSDLCMRVHKEGGKVICIPGIKVTRLGSASGDTDPVAKEWQEAKGFMHYFDKHFRSRYLPFLLWPFKLVIFVRFLLEAVVAKLSIPPSERPRSVVEKRLMLLVSMLAELPETWEFEDRTILVTGATGQVGLCVVRRLLASGANVLALSRGNGIAFQHERLRWIKGDLTGKELDLQGYHIDAVVHCAPLWHLPSVIEILAHAGAKRMIAFGSTSVFTKTLSKNSSEKQLVGRLSRAEIDIADRCRNAGVSSTILRPTITYGVGLDTDITMLAKFIKRFSFFPIYPPAFGRRQPVHADDLAMAVVRALPQRETYGKIYNVSGGETLLYREMVERLFTLYQKKTRIIEVTTMPFCLDMAGLFFRKTHLNGEMARRMNDDLIFFHDDARRDFGFSPRPFLSGGMRDIEGF